MTNSNLLLKLMLKNDKYKKTLKINFILLSTSPIILFSNGKVGGKVVVLRFL